MADASAGFEIPSVEPAQVYRQSIKVTPSAEGVQFVNLTVTLTHDQVTESRAFALPIIVAAQAQAQTPTQTQVPTQAPSAQKPAH